MTSEQNPETGATAIAYVYDTDALCGTSNGDLVKKTDASGNVTCFTHDAVHHVIGITYPSGPNSGNTPSKFFVYGTSSGSVTVNGTAMANAKGRLAEAYTCTSSCTTKLTDEGFSYTVRGEVSDVYESTLHSGGYFHVNELYWANGAMNTITALAGLPTLTYGVDGEGRPYSVSVPPNSGQNPVTSTFYNAASEATLVNFGSLDSDTFQFDPNTLRMIQYKYSVGTGPKTVVGNLTWNANGTLGSLGITDAFVAANTQNCTYSYDDLARLASGNCGSVWTQTFSYDAFGNIMKTGSGQFQPLYSSSTNQMTSIGSFTPSYDTNGDVLNDSLHTYAWDSDTRPTTIDTVTVTYDALDRMVEQSKAGVNTEIVYDCLGNKLALMNGISTLVKGFAPLPAGATAVYTASGLQSYRHADWLGGSRFASTPTRSMYNDLAFAPFGETYARGGTNNVTDLSFAGNHEDTTGSLYDAQFREYGIQGRWSSPDPAGIAAASPANPQSWNRYAYVVNNPLMFSDTTGFQLQPAPGSPSGCFDLPDVFPFLENPDPIFVPGLGYLPYPCAGSQQLHNVGSGGNNPGTRGAGGTGKGKDQSPRCSGAKKFAAHLGQALQETSDDLGLIALAGGVATAVGGLGEGPSLGIDTGFTLSAAGFTAAAGDASLITGAIASALTAYANGDSTAVEKFDAENLFGLAVTLKVLPFLKGYSKTVGDLAQQLLSLVGQIQQGGCQ